MNDDVSAAPTASPAPAGSDRLLVGVPDGGGIRSAFASLSALRVPSLRSVLSTATALTALLCTVTVFVTGVDAVLASLLSGRRLGGAGLLGVLGLVASSVSLGLLRTTALDGANDPRVHQERRRFRVVTGLVLLLLASLCALYWSSGVIRR